MRKLLHKLLERINDTQGIGAFFMGLLGGIFFLRGFCPFSCSVIVAFAILGSGEYMAACGACVGIILLAQYKMLIPLILCVLLCFLWKLWQGDKLKLIDRILILTGSQLSVIFIKHSTLWECLLVPIMCAISIIATIAVYNGILSMRFWVKRKRLAAEGELLNVCILLAFTVFLLSPASTEHIHLAIIVAGCIAELCSCFSGIPGLCVAVLSAFGAGFNYVTGSFNMEITGILAVSCVLCSLTAA